MMNFILRFIHKSLKIVMCNFFDNRYTQSILSLGVNLASINTCKRFENYEEDPKK